MADLVVDRVAEALWLCVAADFPWKLVSEMNREICRSRARAAIAAYEGEMSEARRQIPDLAE